MLQIEFLAQKLASKQPRTSPPKFEKFPKQTATMLLIFASCSAGIRGRAQAKRAAAKAKKAAKAAAKVPVAAAPEASVDAAKAA